jgi:hypothetical protein
MFERPFQRSRAYPVEGLHADRCAGVCGEVPGDEVPAPLAQRVVDGRGPGRDGVEVSPEGRVGTGDGSHQPHALPAVAAGLDVLLAGGPIERGLEALSGEALGRVDTFEFDFGKLVELFVGHARGHPRATPVDGGFGDGDTARVLEPVPLVLVALL